MFPPHVITNFKALPLYLEDGHKPLDLSRLTACLSCAISCDFSAPDQ